ncbi:hypothetical protein BDW66DRAFT_127632 [Aspergillus desertorum]
MEHPLDNYPTLSLPLSQMRPEYDVVVVGSGYGGGVAASRMARAGKSVAVLELGVEWRTGSFPRTLLQCLRELHISGSRSIRNRPIRTTSAACEGKGKLFQLRLGQGQHAFCAHGLGGGSLINAGVFLEAAPETMRLSAWPAEIKDNPDALAEYYARASAMLQPSTYPASLPLPTKTRHLEETARARNWKSSRVPLTTFFEAGRNYSGVSMSANQGFGHESTGLNDGSKNSIPVTYLVDAWAWGAEIFCGCEVRYVERDGDSYLVHFAWHQKGRGTFRENRVTQLFWVRAKEFCFLGAGALGTTEILLRSKKHGLSCSPFVGRNMSGNGNLLVFAYNGTKDINGVAGSNKPGPTITSMIDRRRNAQNGACVSENADQLGGFIIEDGCIPESCAPVIQCMLIMQTIDIEHFFSSGLRSPLTQAQRTLAALKSIIQGPYAPGGAIHRTATYLAMSHDSNEITLTLDDDEPHLQSFGEGRGANISCMEDALRGVLGDDGARMGFSYFYGRHREEVSVHPLGGANMSRDGTGREGVTNHLGQVYAGYGTDVHPGLICCDASIIPTSLGVNPLATITALAERSVAHAAQEKGWSIDLEMRNGDININSRPRISHFKDSRAERNEDYVSTGWHFTEFLQGHVAVPSSSVSYAVAESKGKSCSSTMRVILTVEVYRRVKGGMGPRYKGICIGTVSCRALSSKTMSIMRGNLDFFVPSNASASTTLAYTLPLCTVEGKEFTLVGAKTIDLSTAFSIPSLWKATTTVKLRIINSSNKSIGAGVVRIPLLSFYRQMRTFSSMGPTLRSLPALLIFLLYFIIQLSMIFFHPLIPPCCVRSRTQAHNQATPAKEQPSEILEICTSDNAKIKLDVYDPVQPLNTESRFGQQSQPPILFLPGITGLNPTHSVFTLPFQRCNMVEYFTSRGHRCYVLIPRWGYGEQIAKDCTVFDSRSDIASALHHISTTSRNGSNPSQKPYIIAHCQGSVALAMALLTGTVKPEQILGITANSVFMNQVFGYWNSIKASTPLLIRAYEFLDGPYFPISFLGRRKGALQHALDFLVSLYPVPRRDRCTSPSCRRTSFAFGLLWNHENLDRRVHDNIDKFLTGTFTKSLKHITRMGCTGSCLDNNFNSLLTRRNLESIHGVPILFMSGSENQVFSPESTLRDYELLRRSFGERLYRRFLVQGYGHLDTIVGKDAHRDVYWKVEGHVAWCLQKAAEETE